LGDDALILGQREIRRRRLPWRKAKVEIELKAAIATGRFAGSAAPQGLSDRASPGDRSKFLSKCSASVLPSIESGNSRWTPRNTEGNPSDRAEYSENSVTDSQELRTHSATSPPLNQREDSFCDASNEPFHLFTRLIEQDLDEDIARIVVGELQQPNSSMTVASPSLADRCRELLASSIPCSGGIRVTPGRRRIAALVGPTGVGKTTTIAKLAANFRLRDRLRVGLITVDTYRVAAVQQLKTYAELIDVPMHVVTSPREMPAALDDLAEMDLVLIDTAGRSPSDELRIQELRTFLQAAHADEVHLVASLTAGLRNFALTIERFSRVGPTSLLLTKLDEAAGPGAVVTAAWEAELPLSYITTGQDVPDDIETAEPAVIAQRVLPAGAETAADERSRVISGTALRPRPRVA
jgi:flagellar biosynthesis protein FlhF